MEKSTKIDKFQQNIGFTTADLKFNQQKQLSESQKTKLLQRRNERVWSIVKVSGFISLGIIACISILVFGDKYLSSLLMLTIGALALFYLFCVFLALFSGIKQWSALNRDVKQGNVECVSGAIRSEEIRYAGIGRYFLMIGKEKFEVQQEIYNMFADLTHYVIYYSANSKIIVAAEPLESEHGKTST